MPPGGGSSENSGWNLASYGNNYISYGSELSLVEADNGQWQSDVAALIGGSDILIYPCETDIGSWSEYTDSNEKYTYLQSQGFRYFCIEAGSNLTWIQVRRGMCGREFMRSIRMRNFRM